MTFLIDSDWAIDYLADREPARDLLASLRHAGLALSAITYMEIYQGVAARGYSPVEITRLREWIRRVPVIPFTRAEAERCGDLRAHLAREGRSFRQRALDLIIAATAIEHGLILVTRNRRHYEDLPGLALYEVSDLTSG